MPLTYTKNPISNNEKELISFFKYIISSNIKVLYINDKETYSDTFTNTDIHNPIIFDKRVRKTKNMFKNKHASGILIPAFHNISRVENEFSGMLHIISTSDLSGVRKYLLNEIDVSFLYELDFNSFIKEIKSSRINLNSTKANELDLNQIISIKQFIDGTRMSSVPVVPQRERLQHLLKVIYIYLISNNTKAEVIYNDKEA